MEFESFSIAWKLFSGIEYMPKISSDMFYDFWEENDFRTIHFEFYDAIEVFVKLLVQVGKKKFREIIDKHDDDFHSIVNDLSIELVDKNRLDLLNEFARAIILFLVHDDECIFLPVFLNCETKVIRELLDTYAPQICNYELIIEIYSSSDPERIARRAFKFFNMDKTSFVDEMESFDVSEIRGHVTAGEVARVLKMIKRI